MKSITFQDSGGFTLVEMLVGIGIIAVLAVSLQVVAGKAIEKSNASVCSSRIRSVIAAEAGYSADNNGNLVPYMSSSAPLIKFPDLLQPYVDSSGEYQLEKNQWLQCPSQKKKVIGRTIAGIGTVYTKGNQLHMLHGDPDSLKLPGDPNTPKLSAKRVEISNPAITPSWMDVDGGNSGGNAAYCRGCYPSGGGVKNSAYFIMDDNNFTSRHNGGANVGFVDGHVEWVSIETLRQVPQKNGTDFFRHYDMWPY